MKKLKNKTYLFVCLLLVILTVSCKITEVNVGNVQNMQILEMDKNKMSFQLDLPIENTNNFSFKITKVNLDVSLNNSDLGKVRRINKIKVPANSNQVHSFLFETSYKDLMKNPFSLLDGLLQNKADIKINGYIKVKAFLLISKRIDINENNTTKLFNRKH